MNSSTYWVRTCERCKTKRRISKLHQSVDRWQNRYQHWTCSQGHTWRVMLMTAPTLNRLLSKYYLAPLRKFMNAPSPLLQLLNAK